MREAEAAYRRILESLAAEDRLRSLPPHRAGSNVLDLCSNDYMGLANRRQEWREEFIRRFGDVSMTASASRLLAPDQRVFRALENRLENEYGRPALLFNSGYHANVGIVSALDVPGTLWVADRLVHASMIDGLRMAGAEFRRWRHNDVPHLRRILEKERGCFERVVVMCESVYSMDGDVAPLACIAALRREFPEMILYVDEAHGLGAFGRHGLGKCVEDGISGDVDVLVGTLGKACASVGAFAVTSQLLRDYLVNTSRSFIFSTAIAPANAAWSLLMLEKLAGMDDEREHLARVSAMLREGLERETGVPNPSRSAIVPLITGDAARAVAMSRGLERRGILALPIRRPTVPPGGERIRFSLNAGLCEADIARVIDAVGETRRMVTAE